MEIYALDKTDNSRAVKHSAIRVCIAKTLIYQSMLLTLDRSIVYTGLEPTLSLRLQDVYGFNSTKVGLVILASAVAAVFGSSDALFLYMIVF